MVPPPAERTMEPTQLNITEFFWLILIGFFVAIAVRRVRMPYALALVITGMVVGAPRLLPRAHLDPQILLTVFLPPLLFESAINLRAGPLYRNWKPIAIYTFLGTIASTFIVGGLMAWILHLPVAVALVFGALISTTDPISIIAVFKRLGARRRLTLIMEAESLFNNDTAVVLFSVMMAAVAGRSGSMAIVQFVQLVAGGAALGGAIGLLASRVHLELDDHLVEVTLTTIVAFGSYLAAEALHVSGVMAVVVSGLVLGNLGMPNAMSPATRLAVHSFWEYAAFVVNSIVFLLVGIEVAYVNWREKIIVVLVAVVAVLAGRAAIYPISLLVNRLNGQVPLAWQHVLFWGGLRGALSMALVLGLGKDFPQRDTLIAATFGVVLFSLLVQGLTIGPILKKLHLVGAAARFPDEEKRLASEILACEAALSELERHRAGETHPDWAIESLIREYSSRLGALEETVEALRPGHLVERRQQTSEAKRMALLAEKGALREAELSGWLEEGDLRRLVGRIDHELAELQSERGGR